MIITKFILLLLFVFAAQFCSYISGYATNNINQNEVQTLFSKEYNTIAELSNKRIKSNSLADNMGLIDSNNFDIIEKNITELCDVWVAGNRGLVLSTDSSGKQGLFVSKEVSPYQLTGDVFYLPQKLSKKIRILGFDDWVSSKINGYASNNKNLEQYVKYTPKSSKFIMFDDTNNIVISAGFEGSELVLYKAVQVPKAIKLSDYTVELAFENTAVISSKNKTDIIMLDTKTLKMIESRKMQNWETLIGYNDKLYLKNATNTRTYCLYQIDRKSNILRVYDVKNNKVVKKYNLNKLTFKGKLINVFSDREGLLGLIYKEEKSSQPLKLYFYSTEKNQLYQTEKTIDKSLAAIKQVDNMFFYYHIFYGDGDTISRVITFYDKNKRQVVLFELRTEFPFDKDYIIPIKANLSGFSTVQ